MIELDSANANPVDESVLRSGRHTRRCQAEPWQRSEQI